MTPRNRPVPLRRLPLAVASSRRWGTLVVIGVPGAQMVGAGALIKLLFGLDYWIAVVLVGDLMMMVTTCSSAAAATAILRRCSCWRASALAFMVISDYRFSFDPVCQRRWGKT
jgi:cation/acetate symporter